VTRPNSNAARLFAASPDGRTVVCAVAGRVTIVDGATLAVRTVGTIAADAVSIAFVGTQLAVLRPDELTVIDLPSFENAATVTVPGATTIAGVAGERMVLPIDGAVVIARTTGTTIEREQLERPEPVDTVLALDHDRLLLLAKHLTIIVSATSQRLLSRLSAPMPAAPRLAGVAAGRRFVWLAQVGVADLTFLRLSDGRTFGYRAAETVEQVIGHAESPWIVIATRAGLERVHIMTLAGHPMSAAIGNGACVGHDRESVLYWIDRADHLRRTTLDGDAVTGGPGIRIAITGSAEVAPAAGANHRPGAAIRRVGRTVPNPRRTSGSMWRVELADWTRAVLDDPEQVSAMPNLDDTAIATVGERLALSPPSRTAVALLYGAWLVGGPRLSLDHVNRIVAWDDTAGDGALSRARLTLVVRGRIALRSAVARFLDGAPPDRIAVFGAAVNHDAPRGRVRVHTDPDEPMTTSARTIAARLGAAAITDEARAGGRRGLTIALDEAWLRNLPLIVLASGGLDLDALAAAPVRSDHALVVVWPDREPPPALADWATMPMPR
jgi:hypothetical protein